MVESKDGFRPISAGHGRLGVGPVFNTLGTLGSTESHPNEWLVLIRSASIFEFRIAVCFDRNTQMDSLHQTSTVSGSIGGFPICFSG
jgi:hypothetical protein